jgi:cytochrome c
MRLPLVITAAFAAVALAGPAVAGSAEDIIAKEKCNKCHTEKTTKKGPSWASVATKYKGNADAPNKIFLQLKNGGKVGDEEDHQKVAASDADLKAIAAIVLSSK